jgi:hypothetical protein
MKTCLSKVNENTALGKYVNIPKNKEHLFKEGDYVKLFNLEDAEGDY